LLEEPLELGDPSRQLRQARIARGQLRFHFRHATLQRRAPRTTPTCPRRLRHRCPISATGPSGNHSKRR
jgi:hypothetical protein